MTWLQAMLANIYSTKPYELSQVLWAFARLRVAGVPDATFLRVAAKSVSVSLVSTRLTLAGGIGLVSAGQAPACHANVN